MFNCSFCLVFIFYFVYDKVFLFIVLFRLNIIRRDVILNEVDEVGYVFEMIWERMLYRLYSN